LKKDLVTFKVARSNQGHFHIFFNQEPDPGASKHRISQQKSFFKFHKKDFYKEFKINFSKDFSFLAKRAEKRAIAGKKYNIDH